jgi:flagellar hook-associated protein 1 FlgK
MRLANRTTGQLWSSGMGTLFSALDLGRAGLHVSQVQLDVTGHNIANVNKPGFSRQRVQILERVPNIEIYGAIGRGPYVAGIDRLRDQFLDVSFRQENATFSAAQTAATYFSRIEDIVNEPGDTGLSERLNAFFDALQDFAGAVDDMPTRVATIQEAGALAGVFNEIDQRLNLLRTNANSQVRDTVTEINSLGMRIAELNTSIQRLEATGRAANDLRDDRDILLDELAGLVNIQFNERENGIIDVLIGGDQFITGRNVRQLVAVPTPTIDPKRPDMVEVRFAENNAPVHIRDGSLHGLLQIRDGAIAGLEDQIDELARAIILEVNRLQASGNGLTNFDDTIRTQFPVSDAAEFLNEAGLPFPVNDGTIDVMVYDNNGNLLESITILITANGPAASFLGAVSGAIDTLANLQSSVTDGIMTITPAPGTNFVFANDTSNFLVATGLGGVFKGTDAGTIALNPDIDRRPDWLTSSDTLDIADTGNNTIALLMAQLRNTPILVSNTQNVNEYYEGTLVALGVDARSNAQILEIQRDAVQDFDTRRQEMSGVNIDEEITNLLQYQRAFEASARIITTVDRMLDTLLNIVR